MSAGGERASYSGSTEAFQASNVGSIPTARSKNSRLHEVSCALSCGAPESHKIRIPRRAEPDAHIFDLEWQDAYQAHDHFTGK